MMCREVEDLLALEAAQVLEEVELEALDHHRGSCPKCRAAGEELAVAYAALKTPLPAEDCDREALWEKLNGRMDAVVEQTEQPSAVAIQISLSCRYCHDGLDRSEACYCASCLAPHHLECFRAHGRCTAIGCDETFTVTPDQRFTPRKPRRRFGLYIGVGLAGFVSAAAFGAFAYHSWNEERVRREIESVRRQRLRWDENTREVDRLKAELALARTRSFDPKLMQDIERQLKAEIRKAEDRIADLNDQRLQEARLFDYEKRALSEAAKARVDELAATRRERMRLSLKLANLRHWFAWRKANPDSPVSRFAADLPDPKVFLARLARDVAKRDQALKRVQTLGESQWPLSPVLASRLGDPDPAVRIAAVRALAAIGPRARPAIPRMLDALLAPEAEGLSKEEHRGVRIALLRALPKLDRALAASAPRLTPLLSDQDPAVRGQAVASLGALCRAARAAEDRAKELQPWMESCARELTMDLSFDQTPLEAALEDIALMVDVPVILDDPVRALLKKNDTVVSLRLKGIRLSNALSLLCSSDPALTWRVRGGEIVIALKDAPEGRPALSALIGGLEAAVELAEIDGDLAAARNDKERARLLYRRGIARLRRDPGDRASIHSALDDLSKSLDIQDDVEGALERLKAGERLQDERRYLEAIETLGLVISFGRDLSETDRARAHYQRGLCNIKVGNFVPGVSDFARAIELDPRRFKHFANKVTQVRYVVDTKRVLAELERLVARRGREAHIHFLLGYFHYVQLDLLRREDQEAPRPFSKEEREHLNRGLASLDEARRLNPRFVVAHLVAGDLLRRNGQFRGAQRDLNRAQRLAPKLPYPPYLRALAYLEQAAGEAEDFRKTGLLEDAADQLKIALALEPKLLDGVEGTPDYKLLSGFKPFEALRKSSKR